MGAITLICAVVAAVQGPARFLPLKEAHVEQQLRDNQYVGIGIALSSGDGVPTMNQIIPRGPASLAGAKDKDQILSIDGAATSNKSLRQIVDELRGARGTAVTLTVRQPDDASVRTFQMVRDVVPFETVGGYQRGSDHAWNYRVATDEPIAYLKIDAIKGSTVQELSQIASMLRAEKHQALIIDLRYTLSGELRHAAMLGDALLGEGIIGRVRQMGGHQEYRSRADQLFAGWPMAVLIGPDTRGQAEWLAAALQDTQRAHLVGLSTAGAGFVDALVDLPDGLGALQLRSGTLERADGTTLLRNSAAVNRSSTSAAASTDVPVQE